jgi:hypothetical protein
VLNDPTRRIPHNPDLETYYRDCVIGGLDAFYLTIRRREDVAVAMRQKLVREIAPVRVTAGEDVARPVFAPANCSGGK